MTETDIVCYTAIFDDYDLLFDPANPSENVDYICFTDTHDLNSEVWRTRILEEPELPPNLKNRLVKILPHRYLSEYQYSIYVDGNVQILGGVEELISRYLASNKMACPKHSLRDCVYREAEACLRDGKGDEDKIRAQIHTYREQGFPEEYGLTDNTVLLRRHTDEKVVNLMEAWWRELKERSSRDQLSLPYVRWKQGFECKLMPELDGKLTDCFRTHPHKPQGILAKLFIPWINLRARRDQNRLYSLLYQIGRKVGKTFGIEYPT